MTKSRRPTALQMFTVGGGLAVAAGVMILSPMLATATVVAECPITSPVTGFTGTTLDISTTKSGVVFDPSYGGSLELVVAGGIFTATSVAFNDQAFTVAPGDFDHDGFTDFAGVTASANSFATDEGEVKVYKNQTGYDHKMNGVTVNLSTFDWTVATNRLDPVFEAYPAALRTMPSGSFNKDFEPMGVGDVNGDGWDDIVSVRTLNLSGTTPAHNDWSFAFLNRGAAGLSGSGRTLRASFDPPYKFMVAANGVTDAANGLGPQENTGSLELFDINRDGKLDIVAGSDDDNGTINVFLNNCTVSSTTPNAAGLLPCATAPKFIKSATPLITNLFPNHPATKAALPLFRIVDLTGDGIVDLIVSARSSGSVINDRLRFFPGNSSTGTLTLSSSPQLLQSNGAITSILVADFTLDGKPDIMTGHDAFNPSYPLNSTIAEGGNRGGQTFFYKNNGTATPFSGGITQQLPKGDGTFEATDFDVGFVFDYDNDPNQSPDFMMSDGNSANGRFFVTANRVTNTYVNCGDVASGAIDLGSLASTEMVVTSARISPTMSLHGGSITIFMSNETPENWVTANACTVAPTTDYCANFPKPSGRTVKWKATMCSNAAHTATPTLSGMAVKFDYTKAAEHYRAGAIVYDGISYIGAFKQPGDSGLLYAVNAALGTKYWEAGARINAMPDAARNLYTATTGGDPATSYDATTGGTSRLDFNLDTASSTTPAGIALRSTLGATDATIASNLVSWVRGTRFGIDGINRLGSIVTSTPAVLTQPGRPLWYVFGSPLDRTAVENFIIAKKDRVPLILVGAKDGFIHAIYSFATRTVTPADPRNGTEAWGFAPPGVASGFQADMTATNSTTNPTGTAIVTAYPDGSPTLTDYRTSDGVFHTAALVASGNGGRGVSALDVTDTTFATAPDANTVQGPTPLWNAVPGNGGAVAGPNAGTEPGLAFAKPAVARTLINNTERYVVVAGTGIDFLDATKGRVLAGYDLSNGALLWKFQMRCPLTSDITVFETDDALEPGAPTLNGFVDRAVFADRCGFVYKINPGQDLDGGWMTNAGLGTIQTSLSNDPAATFALFSTQASAGSLGIERPIVGTLATRTDSSTRVVIFFGTGGLENEREDLQNAFFAVYADSGIIRSKETGTCAYRRNSMVCEKFYGGVVVTPDQVIFSRSIDPATTDGDCDRGSSVIQAVGLNPGIGTAFNSALGFNVALAASVEGSLYADAGAVFYATLGGEIGRIGAPRAANAGGDTSSGAIGGAGGGGSVGGTGSSFGLAGMTIMGWRSVL